MLGGFVDAGAVIVVVVEGSVEGGAGVGTAEVMFVEPGLLGAGWGSERGKLTGLRGFDVDAGMLDVGRATR